MAAAYDVQRSLDICDAFSNETERGGCHQGVFMENINESIKRFRETQKLENNDPLFPCNDVDEKYRQQCFMNHGGYIMNVVGSGTGAVEKASAMCLKAGNQVDDCLLSLGMLSTNAGWQSAVVPYGKSTEFYDNALRICAHFVKGTEQKCLFAGISNLSNMYASDIAVSITLCGLVKPEYRQGCFQQIGFTQRLEYPANTQPEQICKGVPRDALGSCFRGAQGFPPE
jgi:hypothetical protein